ncbi:MAG: MraY family glycosyltransferase [Mucinivorans sp.]
MEKLVFVCATFLISFALGWVSIPRIVVISKLKRLFDVPDARKVHTQAIPRLGGISFFPAMMIATTMMLGFRYSFNFMLPPDTEVQFMSEFMFFMAGMFVLFFIGVADDLVGVGYRYKFLAQIFAASMLIGTNLSFLNMGGLLGMWEVPFAVAAVLEVLLIVFAVNAFNLIDGVDGLCSGMSSIIMACLGFWFIYSNMYIYAMISFGMLGVVLSFFRYNISGKRLKIFMGDTGSLTLGFLIIFITLKFVNLAQNGSTPSDIYQIKSPIAIMVGLLFVPLFDTLRVFISRIARGKMPFSPDKTHIHHKLLAMGYSHLHSTLLLMLMQIIFIVLNITLSEVLSINLNLVILIDIILAVSYLFYVNKELEIKQRKTAKNN